MELELIRSYESAEKSDKPGGTNGELNLKICHTIELPWLQNQRNISCIPEGRYELKKRFNKKHQHHVIVLDVPGRNGILIHPANDALKELLGCIAPVTKLTGSGKGNESTKANERLKEVLEIAFSKREKVFIIIKSK